MLIEHFLNFLINLDKKTGLHQRNLCFAEPKINKQSNHPEVKTNKSADQQPNEQTYNYINQLKQNNPIPYYLFQCPKLTRFMCIKIQSNILK